MFIVLMNLLNCLTVLYSTGPLSHPRLPANIHTTTITYVPLPPRAPSYTHILNDLKGKVRDLELGKGLMPTTSSGLWDTSMVSVLVWGGCWCIQMTSGGSLTPKLMNFVLIDKGNVCRQNLMNILGMEKFS